MRAADVQLRTLTFQRDAARTHMAALLNVIGQFQRILQNQENNFQIDDQINNVQIYDQENNVENNDRDDNVQIVSVILSYILLMYVTRPRNPLLLGDKTFELGNFV